MTGKVVGVETSQPASLSHKACIWFNYLLRMCEINHAHAMWLEVPGIANYSIHIKYV